MKNIYVILILFLVNFTFSQDFSGKIIYKSIQKKIKSQSAGNNDYALQFVKQALKGSLEDEFILEINLKESIYVKKDKLENPNINSDIEFMSFNSDEKVYKNIDSKKLIIERELFGKIFLVKDSLEEIDWVLSNEVKNIGDFLCKKASFKKKIILGSIFVEEKIIEVVAWYCPNIPVSNGPEEFWGLPGLILEVDTGVNILVATNISFNYNKNLNIELPNKGEVVTKEQYTNIAEKKIKELEDNFKN